MRGVGSCCGLVRRVRGEPVRLEAGRKASVTGARVEANHLCTYVLKYIITCLHRASICLLAIGALPRAGHPSTAAAASSTPPLLLQRKSTPLLQRRQRCSRVSLATLRCSAATTAYCNQISIRRHGNTGLAIISHSHLSFLTALFNFIFVVFACRSIRS